MDFVYRINELNTDFYLDPELIGLAIVATTVLLVVFSLIFVHHKISNYVRQLQKSNIHVTTVTPNKFTVDL